MLNGTPTPLGYTVPFTLVHARNYRTEDKLNIQTIHKLNTTQKKQTTQNTAEQNYPGSVAFYNTWPGNMVGLLYNTPEQTRGTMNKQAMQ